MKDEKQQIDEASGESGGEDTVAKLPKVGDGLEQQQVPRIGPLDESVDVGAQRRRV